MPMMIAKFFNHFPSEREIVLVESKLPKVAEPQAFDRLGG